MTQDHMPLIAITVALLMMLMVVTTRQRADAARRDQSYASLTRARRSTLVADVKSANCRYATTTPLRL